ncbi:MAG TPA: universal stress protein [Thermodesulfobacteriota bacterium]|nr:universal stress protein [Thermodesulfobacteriota bacterium]
MITVHPLGVLLALVFAVSMGGLLWWMLRVPPYIPAPVAKARVSVEAVKRILVPAVGTVFAGREVELACRLGQEQGAEIQLAYVLEIPRTLPLGAPMPEEEARGMEALKLAKTIVDLHRLPSSLHVLRARVAGQKIVEEARARESDMIVVGIKPGIGIAYDSFARTMDVLMRHAPCELLIDRVGEAV